MFMIILFLGSVLDLPNVHLLHSRPTSCNVLVLLLNRLSGVGSRNVNACFVFLVCPHVTHLML